MGSFLFVSAADYWLKYNQHRLRNLLRGHRSHPKARNIIIFVGDGMGIQTATAGRIYKGQQQGKSGEEEELVWDNFPNTGFSKVRNYSFLYPICRSETCLLNQGFSTIYPSRFYFAALRIPMKIFFSHVLGIKVGGRVLIFQEKWRNLIFLNWDLIN